MEFLIVGGILFWLTFFTVLVLVSIALYSEQAVTATIICLIGIGVLWFFSDLHLNWQWAWNHPFQILTSIGSYIFLGCCWAIIKWWTLARDKLKEFHERKDDFQKEYERISRRPEYTFARYVKDYGDMPPSPGKHKEQIYTWLAFWPLSIIGTFLGDYIMRFIKWLYTRLVTTFDRINDMVFRDSGLIS